MSDAHERITRLLEISSRDSKAAEELLPLVYQELRQVASARMRHLPPGNTLEPTALVHEAYLRVSGSHRSWESRNQFFVAVARSMRNILVDAARRKARVKHGGDLKREEFDPGLGFVTPPSSDVLAVHEAIEELEAEDRSKAELVLLKYFIGLSNEEAADLLGVSVTTVERRWRFLRAWLRRFLGEAERVEDPGER